MAEASSLNPASRLTRGPRTSPRTCPQTWEGAATAEASPLCFARLQPVGGGVGKGAVHAVSGLEYVLVAVGHGPGGGRCCRTSGELFCDRGLVSAF
jgi:hypothetical protein